MRAPCLVALVLTACTSPRETTKAQPKELEATPRESVTLTGTVLPPPAAQGVSVSQPPPGIALGDPGGGAVQEDPVCTPHWEALSHDEIDRCSAGDAAGCTGIGDVYVAGCDAFSSIKWYRRACGLGAANACAALERLGDSRSL